MSDFDNPHWNPYAGMDSSAMASPVAEGTEFVSGTSVVHSNASSPVSRDAIIAALTTVFDPEIPVNIYDLGLIYDISPAAKGRGNGKGKDKVKDDVKDDGREEVKEEAGEKVSVADCVSRDRDEDKDRVGEKVVGEKVSVADCVSRDRDEDKDRVGEKVVGEKVSVADCVSRDRDEDKDRVGEKVSVADCVSRDWDILMTLTAPACPVAGELPQQVADAASSVEGVGLVLVRLTWSPPWTPDMMSEDARYAIGV